MHHLYLLFLALSCCFLGCREEEPNPLAFIVTEADFGYTTSTNYDLAGPEEAISHLVGVDETIIFSTSQGAIRAFNAELAEMYVLLNDVQTSEIEVAGRLVYFCTDRGMYRFDLDAPREMVRIATTCEHIEVVDDDIYFTTFEADSINDFPNRVFTLVDGEIEPLSPLFPSSVGKLAVLPSNELVALPVAGPKSIYHLDLQGNLLQSFDEEAYHHSGRYDWHKTWATTTDNDLLIVSKPNVDYPSIASWSIDSARWTNRLVPETLKQDAELYDTKLNYLLTATFTDVLAINDQLYITTSDEDCLGLFQFNLAGNRPFRYDDFTVIQDARIGEDQCLQGIHHDEDSDALYIYTQHSVVKFQ